MNLQQRVKEFLQEEKETTVKHLAGMHNQKLHGNRGGATGVREGAANYGIPKSTLYKLVRKSDNVIIAEGSKKNISSMQKKTPGTFVGLTTSKIGEKFGAGNNLPNAASFVGKGLPGDYARAVAKTLDEFDFSPSSFGGVIKGHLKTMIHRVGFFNDDLKTYNSSRAPNETRPNLKSALAAKKNLEVSYNKLVSIVESRKDMKLSVQLDRIDKMIKSVGGNEKLVKKPEYGLWTEFDFGGDNFSSFTP